MTDDASLSGLSGAADPGRLPGLHWGLKRSFVDYVRRMPDGQTGLGGGATAIGEYEIVYPISGGGRRIGDDGVEETLWEFSGHLQFKAHGGMLAVQISSPAVFIVGDAGTLSVVDPVSRDADGRRHLLDVTMEKHLATEKVEIWHSTAVRLRSEGVEVFNDVYPEGEPFEHLTIVTPVIPTS